MYTRGKRFILLVASTAVTRSARFAPRRFWRMFSERYSHLWMSVRNRLPNRERNSRPTSFGASGLEAATPGCCLRLHVSNHRLIPDFILSSL
jgi:hypothetical protein